MAQHDYNIANAGGATVRADINNVLAAVQSLNSGTGAPSSTVAGMLWLDTAGGLPYALKIRDGGNNHWLTIASVTDPGSDGNIETSATIKGTIDSSATLTNATFPAGHIVQTVNQTYHTTTVVSTYITSSTHIETEINITAGNKIFYNYTIPTRLFASGYNYGQYKYYVYHKVTSGGTYAPIISGKTQGSYYYDLAGNLPTDFYRDVNFNMQGVFTPSSGTQHFLNVYVEFIQGNSVSVGQATTNTQQVTLMEIQS